MKTLFRIQCLLGLALTLLIGCKNQNQKEIGPSKISYEDFPSKTTMDGEQILQDDYFHHHQIHVLDTILLTTSIIGDYHFHAYNIETLDYLGSVGVRGEGPDEWTIPNATSGQYEISESGINFWIYDYLRGHFSKINLTKTLRNGSPTPVVEKSIPIDVRNFPYYRLFYINDEKLVADCWITEQDRVRIKSYNPQTGEVSKSNLFPKMENINLLPAEVINSLYSGSFSKHPTKNLFVQAMFVHNRIDIFDENLALYKTMVDGENWQDHYYDAEEIDITSNYLQERVDGYNGLSLTNKYIFALEMDKDLSNRDKPIKNFIRVYDWEGNPVELLEFNHKINGFAVDETKGVLYATDYLHEKVLKYNIQNLLNK